MFRSAVLALAAILPFALPGLSAQDAPAKPAGAALPADAVQPADAQPPAGPAETFVRVSQTDSGEPQGLDTAIVRFTGRPGTKHADAVVDLVGVVHIGQDDYYSKLKKRLAGYDVVLYELVAPDGTRIRPEDLQKRRSLLASMQTGMKDMLNLEYQLEKIDYMAKNFRHADMSPEEFSKDMQRRGDNFPKMIARMMGAGLAAQAKTGGSEFDILTALFSTDRAMMMKRAMATQLSDIEMATAGMDDENGDNTLIKGRNAKAFQVLEEVLKDGQKKVAVFYGAGHLNDMADRLRNDFDMTPVKTTWLQAWDLQSN
ncbi:TraB/GumN family protein [Roseimaritima ulvae]|uniref:TraB family protein n=1 Tax=Roseimaritima ulvae TaxID=980254 RepID=A0A5B9QP30_9BACT|nr:hypothetical protein [Roseimaritima ulvae]QEG39709.1 hypothetical protein UC8_17070 [Roseimaritima ulvae]